MGWKRSLAVFTILTSLVLCCNTWGAELSEPPEYDLSGLAPESKNQLYFSGLEQLDMFDTVSVFLSLEPMDREIADTFFTFAGRIGRTNGATYVNAKDYRSYSDVLTKLHCRTVDSNELPVVLFATRGQRACYIFPLSTPDGLREVLLTIERNLSCPDDLKFERVGREIRRVLADLGKAKTILQPCVRPAVQLADWLIEQLATECGRKSPVRNAVTPSVQAR